MLLLPDIAYVQHFWWNSQFEPLFKCQEAMIAWYTNNAIKLIKAGIAYLSKIVKYDIVGKRIVTADLKLIDDNIKVSVEPF